MKTDFTILEAKHRLPKRVKNDNKTRGGHSLIIAGSRGMWGAAILAATAAARVGSGYTSLLTSNNNFPTLRGPDFLTADLSTTKAKLNKFTAIAVGPGLGRGTFTTKVLRFLLEKKFPHVLLDADALNTLANLNIKKLPPSWILTPHEGELSRLLNISANKIRLNRKFHILQATKKFACVVLLKGEKTLIAQQNKITEIKSGNVALAKAGTGDVLTGMITGFLAQGLSPLDAACLGTYVHGDIADDWVRKKNNDYLSLIPSDILTALPAKLSEIRKKS